MKYELQTTPEFSKWVGKIKDRNAAKAIAVRLTRIQAGLYGETKSVGGGVSELKIRIGKGYRVYYTIKASTIVLLLCGGDKSTQSADIKLAKKINSEV